MPSGIFGSEDQNPHAILQAAFEIPLNSRSLIGGGRAIREILAQRVQLVIQLFGLQQSYS